MNNAQTIEGYLLMMLLEAICKVGFKLRRGKIATFADCKNFLRFTIAAPQKLSWHAQDYRAIKSQLDEVQKKLIINIEINYSSKEIKDNEQFEHNR